MIIKLKRDNPLTANGELSRHENLTFLWTWILRWVPRSFATHASLSKTLSSNKTVKILALKGLREKEDKRTGYLDSNNSAIFLP